MRVAFQYVFESLRGLHSRLFMRVMISNSSNYRGQITDLAKISESFDLTQKYMLSERPQ